MESVINKIRIPLDKPLSRIVVSVKKNDANTRKLCITLTNNGVVYELKNIKMAAVKGIKPDNTIFYNDCVIDCNEIQYTLTSKSIAVEGCVKCELVLYGDDTEVITSARFDIYVYDSVFDDDVIESTDEYNLLLMLINKYEQIYEEVIIYAEDAENAVNSSYEATRRADEAARRAEEAVKRAGEVIKMNIIIPAEGWNRGAEECTAEEMYIDVLVDAVDESMIPITSIIPSDILVAEGCGLMPSCRTLHKKVRFYSRQLPEKEIAANLVLITEYSGAKIMSATIEEVNEMLDEVFTE